MHIFRHLSNVQGIFQIVKPNCKRIQLVRLLHFHRFKSNFLKEFKNSQSCMFGKSFTSTCKCNFSFKNVILNGMVRRHSRNFSVETLNRIEEEEYLRQGLSYVLQQGLTLEDLTPADLSLVTERYGLKGLNMDYIYEYGIKVSPDLETLMFPFDSLDKELSAIQTVSFKKNFNHSAITITSSRPSTDVLFGWSSVSPHQKEIIIVSHPLDAVAINQETDLPVISHSCDFVQFSSELINILKTFHKVYFWLKPELQNPTIHRILGRSLGTKAYFINSQESYSALRCLQTHVKIKDVLKEANPIYHEGVDEISSYRSILYDRFKNHDKYSGVKWQRFSALNDILKGHRRGELTVFSGQTGTGKTTFMSEYSLDLCIQGIPTLWANFEISNEKLLETMFCQYARCSFIDHTDEFHLWFDKFEKLPMYILNIKGRKSFIGMLQAMKIYARAFNVQHVVIDNLQFLMNIENYGSTIDHFRRQDEIFGACRGFATRCNCHVTIVIHPRKEPQFTELNNASISGTSKATQEADNILILQTTKTRQYLHVTKNRYSGDKGCIVVEFDKTTQTFKQKKNITLTEQDQKKLL